MKKHLSFIVLFAALFCGSSAFATSVYYTFPKGGFAAGMTANSDTAEATFFLPHIPNGSHVFNSTDTAVWQSGQELSKPKTTYTFSSKMKKTSHTPHIAKVGKMSFQYGSTNTADFDSTLLFHIGDSMMRYMTPARLWTDLEAESNGYKEGLGDNYRSWVRDTMGDYFNNIDIMYVDGLSIPIIYDSKNLTNKTEDDMFPEGAHVIVNIYKADSIAGKTGNKTSRSEVLWTGTLTKTDFTPFKEDVRYRGALNVTFNKPLIIEGPFVVELTDVKNSGCHFYGYSDKSNGRNKWGYCLKDEKEYYPGSYCLAISVHAMFPALTQAVGDSLTVIMKSTGASAELKNRPYRAIYSNVLYDPNSNDWEIYASDGLSVDYSYSSKSSDYTNWQFSMDANSTDDIRYEEFSITFRGQNLTYKIVQAPMLKSFSFAESEVYVGIGEQVQLEPVLVPATSDQNTFKWSTEKDAVAMVNSEGLVTGMTNGVVTITATSKTDENIKASCTVIVGSGADLKQVNELKTAKAAKTIENGQLVIIRDGKRFSILGAAL